MSAEQRPPLRVIRGDATPEEIAAIVAVLAAAGGGNEGGGDGGRRPSRWASPAGRLRPPVAHGLGAWRGSALPH
ncbi:acyl-CoA carboxylase subunit epsilon [Nostocoides sp. F2B08]|uniref:acyl-CoA carboxylase epsilon subunit n=1 Tax=Nostocoides sp. F2B08 TaxID=2653936 RepID=UPI001263077C|nr:acyl-CoA carboxylase epsilon subunit [Tetrasphaera sp. F2B08]KAB7741941.1 acyl-CoA carboxylase subunit epsilon [Tetrasphaera sp. F2B08]